MNALYFCETLTFDGAKSGTKEIYSFLMEKILFIFQSGRSLKPQLSIVK